MKPCISVIIPIYNMHKTLPACLDSILSQSLKNLEIICIDDGSTDKSLKVLKEYAKTHPQIKIITQSNMGSGPARNAGISAAEGEYLAFADSDDYYFDDTVLEKLYNAAKNNSALICGGRLINALNGETFIFEKDYRCELFQNNFVEYLSYQEEFGYQAYIYNSEFIKSNKLFFPPYRRFQDPPWFVKTMYIAQEFFSTDVKVYVYKGGGAHVNWTEQKYYDSLCGMYDVVRFASENNLKYLMSISCRRILSQPQRLPENKLNKRLKDKLDEILLLCDVECFNELNLHYPKAWINLYYSYGQKEYSLFCKFKDFCIFGEWRK